MLIQISVCNAFKDHVLIIKMPEVTNFEKYTFIIDVENLNSDGSVFSGFDRKITESRQIISCTVRDGTDKRTGVPIEITLSVGRRDQRYFDGKYCKVHVDTIQTHGDTIFYEIPSLPSNAIIDEMLIKNRRAHQKKNLKDFGYNLTHDWNSLALYASYYQGHRPFGEIMISPSRYNSIQFRRSDPKSPLAIYGFTYGSEFNFEWNDKFILGPKIGFNFSTFLLNAGIHAIYYTDFQKGSFCLIPRIGINPFIPFVNISYGYVIRFGPDHFGNRINQHQLCINFIIPLKLED